MDTSFRSDSRYEVGSMAVAGRDSIDLIVRPVVPFVKTFPLDEDFDAGFVFVDQSGRVRGFVATRFAEWNRRLIIQHFYVDAGLRGQGVGRRLMQCAVDAGRRQGARVAWLETSNLNVAGVQTYRALGFQLCGLDTSLYAGTDDAADEFALFLCKAL